MLIRDVSNERGGEKKDAGRKRLTSPFEMSHEGNFSTNLVIVLLFSFLFFFLHRCATSNIPFSVGLIKSTGFLFHLCTKIKVKLFQIVHKQPWSPQRNVSEAQSAHMLDSLCQSMLFECVSALRGPFRLQNHDRYLFFSAQCRGLILRKRTEKQRRRKCKERRSLMLQDF